MLLVLFGLGYTPFVLCINPYCTFCVFLVKSGDLLSLFSSLSFGGFYFLFSFIVAQLHACVVCIALPTGLAVVPTQGSYFVFFCCFFRVLFLEKIYALARRRANKGWISVLGYWNTTMWHFKFWLNTFVVWILGQNLW